MPKHLYDFYNSELVPHHGIPDDMMEKILTTNTNVDSRSFPDGSITLEWIKITDVIFPQAGFKYITMNLEGNRNDLYFAENKMWYHSEHIYEKYPEKSLSGITHYLNN